MTFHARAVAAAALSFLAAAGCGRPTSPAEPRWAVGAFVLERVGDSALPAVWVENPFVRVEVVADTLWLYPDGTGVQHRTQRRAEPGEAARMEREESRFTYELADARIQIAYECVDVVIRTASCIAPPHAVGEISARGMRLLTFHGNQVEYRRL